MRFTGFSFVANIGSLLPFLLRRLHQFLFCLVPMTLVITVPPTARKPDVVRAVLNLPPQGCIRNVTVAIIGIHFCLHVNYSQRSPEWPMPCFWCSSYFW